MSPRRSTRPWDNPAVLETVKPRRRTLPGTVLTEFSQTYQESYRVEDTSLAVYELFGAVDSHPDFTKPPQATFTAPPFLWTPPLPSSGNGTVHVVVRRRNKYNLESFNVWETILVFTAGVAGPLPLTAPRDVAVYDGATGFVRVLAKYISIDDASPADTWELYAKVGSDPVPGVDTPAYTGLMVFAGVESGLAQVVGSFGPPGSILHVIVTALRSSDSARASAAPVLHTLKASLNLSDAELFGGETLEQEQ